MGAEDNLLVARDLITSDSETTIQEWGLNTVAGRFVEITGTTASATVTTCVKLILQAQENGEWVAWICGHKASFFPPDFAASGINLASVLTTHVVDMAQALRVADSLLRSGAFALVVLHLGNTAKLPFSVQTRLVGLAKQHHTALVHLTRRRERDTSQGSLVSLRADTTLRRIRPDCFLCEIEITKDKRRIPGWKHMEIYRGTDGLC